MSRKCKIVGCHRKYKAKEYCHYHYRRLHQTAITKFCSVKNCHNKHSAKGYCEMHYSRMSTKNSTELTRVKNICSVENCNNFVHGNNLCHKHYSRMRANGTLELTRKEPAPAGSGWIDKDGYRKIHINGKRISEHRHVMEVFLRRKLFPHETIHHLNGNRIDNRIENLELWNQQQPSGQRVQDKINFYIDFLQQYGYQIIKL